MFRMFIGKVIETDENTHVINFSIDDFANTNSLSAIPLSTLNIFPEAESEVLIIQPNSQVEIFYYTQMPETDKNLIQLKYNNAVVKVEKTSTGDNKEYKITVDTSNDSSIILEKEKITMKAKGSTIEMSNDKVLVNNHLKVTV